MGLSEQKAHCCCTVEVVSFSSYSLLLLTGRINEDIERSHHHIFSITNNNAKYSISSGSCCTSITHKIIFTQCRRDLLLNCSKFSKHSAHSRYCWLNLWAIFHINGTVFVWLKPCVWVCFVSFIFPTCLCMWSL